MSDFMEQVPFSAVEFAENPEPRCPCLLLLDTSGSMKGAPILELNNGITTFKEELMSDSMGIKRVEISIISFGPVKVETDFVTADLFKPPALIAKGDTPMGEAIEEGLKLLRERKLLYRQNGVSFYRPWIFLITDGGPTDNWHKAAKLIEEGEKEKAFTFFTVGVENANMDVLKKLSIREPLKLKELRFRDLFLWLSNSLGSVARASFEEQVHLESPVTPKGWASVNE
jgi:uncharacterized protein YegL